MWPLTPLPIVSEDYSEYENGSRDFIEVLRDQLAAEAEKRVTSRGQRYQLNLDAFASVQRYQADTEDIDAG